MFGGNAGPGFLAQADIAAEAGQVLVAGLGLNLGSDTAEFLVLGFDARDASLSVLNDLGYSAANRQDALDDAQAAASQAGADALPLT